MELLSVKEAAEVLGIGVAMVARYCQQSRLKAQKVGAAWVIRREDLDAFAANPRLMGRPPLEPTN